ncbi:MAG: hypothetical protein ACRDOK_07160 [Streptosporangiaceae bacterium]
MGHHPSCPRSATPPPGWDNDGELDIEPGGHAHRWGGEQECGRGSAEPDRAGAERA